MPSTAGCENTVHQPRLVKRSRCVRIVSDSGESVVGEKGVDVTFAWRCERNRSVRSDTDLGLPQRAIASALCIKES